MVKKAGEKVGIRIRPHDLRRFEATYVSRSGVLVIADGFKQHNLTICQVLETLMYLKHISTQAAQSANIHNPFSGPFNTYHRYRPPASRSRFS